MVEDGNVRICVLYFMFSRLSKAQKTAVRVIRRIRYFVSRKKFQVITPALIKLTDKYLISKSLFQFDCVVCK